jgi:hypothetical protein
VFRSSPWNVILLEKQRPCVTETASRSPATFHDRYGLALDLITRQCTDTLERLRARTFGSPYHGWLTLAAPGARTQVVANGRWCFATAFRFPRGAYAPRSCAAMRTSAGEKRFLRCTNADPTRSGGRQPAVVRQTRLRRHQRDCSQDRREYVPRSPLPSCAAIPRGAYAPRSCAAMRTSAGEKTIFAMHRRTSDQERRVSARRGSDSRLQRRPAFSDRIRLAPHMRIPRHGWLTPAAPGCTRASRPKWAVVLCNGAPFPTGGLRPPLLCCNANVCRRKTIFAMYKRRSDQERRASARRGSTNTFTQTPARLLARPSTVCGPNAVAFACSDTTGGLRPPLLCCNANVRRRKTIFSMHKRTSGQERRASARRGFLTPVQS